MAGLFLWFGLCAPLHLAAKLLTGRSSWPQRFLGGAAWICGARVRTVGKPAGRHTLLVPNHTSWLDIMVLAGATNCAFVSKDNLGHGLLHWLADQNATVYVDRANLKGAKDQAVALAKSLEGEKPVTVFAEGTTGPGTRLLPFRSTLFEAANYAAEDVTIRPVAVDYGSARDEVGWFEESGLANVFRILGRRGSLPVTVNLLDPLDRLADRKTLAAAARHAIAETLGLTSWDPSPIGGGE